jgi:hypothetical protein
MTYRDRHNSNRTPEKVVDLMAEETAPVPAAQEAPFNRRLAILLAMAMSSTRQ